MPKAAHSHVSASTGLPSLTRVVVSTLLAMLGMGLSVWAYQWAGPEGPLLYWGILPGAPFVLLAGLSLVPQLPLRTTIGACVGSAVAVAIPYGALMYASVHYAGGGASIGLGLLLLATPIFLPIAMLMGGFLGGRFGSLKNDATT